MTIKITATMLTTLIIVLRMACTTLKRPSLLVEPQPAASLTAWAALELQTSSAKAGASVSVDNPSIPVTAKMDVMAMVLIDLMIFINLL